MLAAQRLRRRKLQQCRRPWANAESNCFANSNPGRATAYTFANSNTTRSHANSDANCLANANSNATAERRQ